MIYLILSISIYLLFVKLKEKLNSSLINPLLLSSILIIIILKVFEIDFETYYQDVTFINFLLGPATVSLALLLYEYKSSLVDHAKTIMVSIMTGVIAHAISIVALIFILKLDKTMSASLLPKSVTTAIAKDIAFQNGGIQEITIALVIITGIYGALICDFVFKHLKVKSKVAKGLALGVSAHAVGTSKAIEYGEEESVMASIALILTALITVIVVPLVLRILF